MNEPIKAEQDAVTYREAVNTHGIDVITPSEDARTPRGKDAFSDRRTPYDK